MSGTILLRRSALGDVILQGDNATITTLRANSDGITPQDGFDGVVGTIYAGNLGDIDVGDGLRGSLTEPLARAGIFAANDIQRVGSTSFGQRCEPATQRSAASFTGSRGDQKLTVCRPSTK